MNTVLNKGRNTPSQQAKSMGLKSLTQVRDLHGFNKNGHPLVSLNTLTNWHRDKPELFQSVLIGAAYRLGCLREPSPDKIRCGEWLIEYRPNGGSFDWEFIHDDHNGKSWSRGTGSSIQHCVDQINDREGLYKS